MKNRVILIVMVVLVMMGSMLYSQNFGSKNQEGRSSGERPSRQPSVEDRVARLTTELSLTDDQVTQLTAIMEKQEKEVSALREERSSDRSANMEKMKELHESFEKEIMEILDKDQQVKFQELSKNQRPGNREKKSPRG